MKKFKIEASKETKKYTLIFHSNNENEAKNRIHKEGYSILSIKEIGEEDINGNKFIFKGEINGEIKSGMIVGNDIFKVYVKLVDSFKYKIKYIYPENEKNTSLNNKNKILKEIEEQYIVFKNNKENKLNRLRENRKKEKKEKKTHEDFHMKKELEQTYELIVFILKKIKTIIDRKGDYELGINQKEKFKLIYNEIIKLKKTTNLAKLKQIGEIALLKIGKLEVDSLNNKKSQETSILLKETNKILKKIGSDKQFIEKRKDIKYILEGYFTQIINFFYKKKKKKKKKIVDKNSYVYLKTILLISKYKKKLKENNLEIIKYIYVFFIPFLKNHEKKESLLLKRKVIKQNILLLKRKIYKNTYSYTKIKNTIKILYEKINKDLIFIRKTSFNITLLYSILFVIYVTYMYYFNNTIYINYNGIFYFIVLMLIYISTLFSRGFISLILNFVILFFIVIFGIINF